MEAILVREGLWSLVKPTAEEKNKRIQDKMARARAEMILRVEDNQLVHMISPDPMEIWLTLQRIHQAAGFATSLSLRRKFLTAKKSDHQTMQAWIGQIQGLAFRMEHAKIAVTDQDKILAITMGLPPSFDNVIINFDSMSPETLTLDLVIARLLNEEVRQITTAPSLKEDDQIKTELDEAMAVSRAKAISEVLCFFCDAKGHYKSDCPERKAWEKSKSKKTSTAAGVWESSDDEAF
jgi:gag-polypeptide of LTR copia-type/Zinc knuckle